jgi:hypothetical protein
MKALKKLLVAALVVALPLASLAQTTPAEPAKPAEAAPAPAAPAAAPAPKPADDSIKVTPYGFVLLNFFWDMGTFTTKDYPGQVAALDVGDAFLGSARQSRFGVRLAGKDNVLTGADLAGTIEFDFKAGHVPTSATCTDDGDATTPPVCAIGSGNTASTAWYNGLMRLRIASASATWKSGGNSFAILFGQDYGLVNPLFAESLAWVADPLFWQAGNLWRRAPQIRATYAGKFGDMGLTLQAAALSPADATTGAPHAVDFGAGNANGVPDLEARAAFNAKFGDIGGTVGVGYHMSSRKYLNATGAETDSIDVNVLGVDADLNITKFLQVKGEYYTGSGADDVYAGPSPSIVGAAGARDTVDTDGFWVQAILKPVPFLNVHVGYGEGSGDDAVITAATAREKNTQFAGGVIVNAGKAWRFGAEYIQVNTTYGNDGTGTPAVDAQFDASQFAISSQLRF